ncbi:MAG: FHA domain-containing protein [Rhodobacteraceae bacterium]|nr:FHA domain-containing protein [Paracoccaceae bacterium]
MAQDEEFPVRQPKTGLAILDCAPPSPAPENSCLMRVPSDHRLGNLSSRSLGDQSAAFRIVRRDDDLPDGLVISSTLVLIDLSRGPNNGRLGSWSRERDQIQRVLSGLPLDGEVAVYGFGANLQQIAPFSRDRYAMRDALEELVPDQNNTILSSNITDAIELLAARERTLLKNLIIISDGEEEGVPDFERVTAKAAEAGVTLSALGMFWRAQGNAATSRGIDVLDSLTQPQSGLSTSVFLTRGAEAAAAVGAFIAQYGRSVGDSGLILPSGDPALARITIEMQVPIPGEAGNTETRSYSVQFTPARAQGKAPEPESMPPPDPVDEDLIFGFPALWVYIAASVAGLSLLILLFLLQRDSRSEETDGVGLGGGEAPGLPGLDNGNGELDTKSASGTGLDETVLEAPPALKPQPISAYLVRTDTGERLALRGDRISIGRSSTNEVVIPDQGISRVHAEMRRSSEGAFALNDLDSLNGTFVNDRKIKAPTTLRIGDTVGFGKVRAKLTLP